MIERNNISRLQYFSKRQMCQWETELSEIKSSQSEEIELVRVQKS